MYIDKDSRGHFQLMDMDIDELKGLAEMIRGAGLRERRMFHNILKQIQ